MTIVHPYNTVTAVLRAAATASPDAIFVDLKGETHSYRETLDRALGLAKGLVEMGVRPGDTVVSILDNNFDAVVAWFAINFAGAVSVPVNTAYKGEYLRHQIDDAGASLVIAEPDYALRVIAAGDLPKVKAIVCRGFEAPNETSPYAMYSLDRLIATGDDRVLPVVEPSQLSMLIYTSGTTGPSKGCMISHGYACNLARQSLLCSERTPEDIFWTALPLFHMNATATGLLSTAMLGGRVAIYPRFSLSGFWPDILRSGATSVGLLGSMQHLIAEAADTEESIRCFGQLRVVGAAPFPKELQEKWRRRFGAKVMGAGGYGLTEAAMVTTGPLSRRQDPDSSGPVSEDFDVIIVDDHDQELPVGERGEVLIRPRKPDVMFSGYWNRPSDTLAILKNLWLHSGDIGRFGKNGEFYFLDRKKDYLRRRGENISSFEMETTFRNHPELVDVAVHAVLSAVGEDDVKLTCIRRDNSDLSEAALCQWAIERVPYFAVPRYIEFRDDLPRNPTGKVLKYQLREEGCTPTTWDREKNDITLVKR